MFNTKSYEFGSFHLNRARRILRQRDGSIVPISPKALELLLVLVESSGQLLTKDELMERVWSDSFVEEGNLTQTVSVLRKTLGEQKADHRFIVTEPGRGYRFVANVQEVVAEEETDKPEALTDVTDWQNEVAGTQITASRRNGFEESVPAIIKPEVATWWRQPFVLPLALPVLLSLSVASYFLIRSMTFNKSPTPVSKVNAVAVLPFTMIGTSDNDEYLGLGMTDTLITRLSNSKQFIVRQTSAVLPYADASLAPIKIGSELKVDALFEGSVQKSNDRIRVTVRLIRVSDGTQLWARTVDGDYHNFFALQDSISDQALRALTLQLAGNEQPLVKNRSPGTMEAYLLYQKGRFFWNKRTADDLQKSVKYYEQAVATDPTYALAYAGLAESYAILHTYDRDQAKDAFPKARVAAEKSLTLDESLAEAHSALALVKEQHDWDWPGAEREFKRAIELNPSYATAYHWYSEFLAFMGRTDESIAQIEHAHELDPQSLAISTARAFPYLCARRNDQAITILQQVLEMDQDFPLALYYLGRSYSGKGMYDQAIASYRKAISASGGSAYFLAALGAVYASAGRRQEANATLAELSALAKKESISPYLFARIYAGMDEKQHALDELEKAYRQRDDLLTVLNIDGHFDGLRNEPRFQNLLRQMNFK